MRLSDHDLRQINESYLEKSLEEGRLLEVSLRLLADLKAARERLNQTSQNSSVPPSARPIWERDSRDRESTTSSEESVCDRDALEASVEAEQEASESAFPEDTTQTNACTDAPHADRPKARAICKKAGKQHGAQGYGRTQKIAPQRYEYHHPSHCAACGAMLAASSSQAYTGWDEIDVESLQSDQMGLHLICTRHVLYATVCSCGHNTRAAHVVVPRDANWDKVELGQWRLVGPSLAAALVFLAHRMHMSRARIQEFLLEFLNLQLSIGVIDETLREAGRAVEPLEDCLARDLEQAALMHIDETPWRQAKLDQSRWLWVFVCAHTALYVIGPRTLAMFEKVFMAAFMGNIMTDGYLVYRGVNNRLRCWAHLLRKLKGLADSLDARVAQAGNEMLGHFCKLMEAIYAARIVGPPTAENIALRIEQVESLKRLCEMHREDEHTKLRALAREFLLDWEIIMRQAYEVDLPLTNNAAEQALRHWVIARRISQGTRSNTGSRAFALLASVIETCRRRKTSSWRYLATVIANARCGIALPALPAF